MSHHEFKKLVSFGKVERHLDRDFNSFRHTRVCGSKRRAANSGRGLLHDDAQSREGYAYDEWHTPTETAVHRCGSASIQFREVVLQSLASSSRRTGAWMLIFGKSACFGLRTKFRSIRITALGTERTADLFCRSHSLPKA